MRPVTYLGRVTGTEIIDSQNAKVTVRGHQGSNQFEFKFDTLTSDAPRLGLRVNVTFEENEVQ